MSHFSHHLISSGLFCWQVLLFWPDLMNSFLHIQFFNFSICDSLWKQKHEEIQATWARCETFTARTCLNKRTFLWSCISSLHVHCVFYLLQVVAGADVMLPGDEIWLCDLDSGTWWDVILTFCVIKFAFVVSEPNCLFFCVLQGAERDHRRQTSRLIRLLWRSC